MQGGKTHLVGRGIGAPACKLYRRLTAETNRFADPLLSGPARGRCENSPAGRLRYVYCAAATGLRRMAFRFKGCQSCLMGRTATVALPSLAISSVPSLVTLNLP